MLRFLTCCYGEKFAPYLFVLLNSIDEVYEGKAQVVVYYDNLPLDITKEIKRKAPFVYLRHYDLSNLDSLAKIANAQAGTLSSLSAKQQTIAQERLFLTAGINDLSDGPIVVMDCDMLVRHTVGHNFAGNDYEFDIAFTCKTEPDEQLQWPINCGIQLVNNSDKVRAFYNNWQTETDKLFHADPSTYYPQWGGIQQAAFGHMIQTRNPSDYQEGFTRQGCFLVGIPCKYLNETRRTQNFEDACVLHYKGPWREVLETGRFNVKVNRNNAGKMYALWQGHLERWNAR